MKKYLFAVLMCILFFTGCSNQEIQSTPTPSPVEMSAEYEFLSQTPDSVGNLYTFFENKKENALLFEIRLSGDNIDSNIISVYRASGNLKLYDKYSEIHVAAYRLENKKYEAYFENINGEFELKAPEKWLDEKYAKKAETVH